MENRQLSAVRAGRDLLTVVCAIDFFRFLNAPAGERPPFAGAVFLLTAAYIVVLYGPLAESARKGLSEEDGPAYPDLWYGNLWEPSVSPGIATMLFAVIFGAFGIAMLLA